MATFNPRFISLQVRYKAGRLKYVLSVWIGEMPADFKGKLFSEIDQAEFMKWQKANIIDVTISKPVYDRLYMLTGEFLNSPPTDAQAPQD